MKNIDIDLKKWNELKKLIGGEYKYNPHAFFLNYAEEISHLFSKYAKTINGYSVNPNKEIRQKFRILEKSMEQLENNYNEQHIKNKLNWDNQQREQESLDTKLEREKGEWESRNGSIKLSKRDN